MGWECISDACKGHINSNGVWDGVGIAYYSIREDIFNLHDIFFAYMMNLSGSAYALLLMLFIIGFIVAIALSVKNMIAVMGKNV